jgi:antitoxin ParD1/3/4
MTIFDISGKVVIDAIRNEDSAMSSSLNVSLTDELRRFVDSRASDQGVYSTPSEYIRDLIRRDMEGVAILTKVRRGLDDIKNNRFSNETVLDIIDEYR